MSAITLRKFYEAAVAHGMKNDVRAKSEITRLLKEEKDSYKKLSRQEQAYFDTERLTNPYADTRILHGKGSETLRRIMVGIDLEGAELLAATMLSKHGKQVDLAISHHPEGRALARLHDVMDLQADLYESVGLPINITERLTGSAAAKVGKGIHAINHNKNTDLARLLGLPYMCLHTPADNNVYTYLVGRAKAKQPRTVNDVVEMLMSEPEYQDAARQGAKPMVAVGSGKSRAGKIVFTGFTGGTSGSADIYEHMKHAGIGTEVVMHAPAEHLKAAEKHHINVVFASHIASDSLGMNLVFDACLPKNVEILEVGGFTRHTRRR